MKIVKIQGDQVMEINPRRSRNKGKVPSGPSHQAFGPASGKIVKVIFLEELVQSGPGEMGNPARFLYVSILFRKSCMLGRSLNIGPFLRPTSIAGFSFSAFRSLFFLIQITVEHFSAFRTDGMAELGP